MSRSFSNTHDCRKLAVLKRESSLPLLLAAVE